MIFSTILNRTRNRLARHRQYRKVIDEITALTDRDLADFNGNRGEMLRRAYSDFYGR